MWPIFAALRRTLRGGRPASTPTPPNPLATFYFEAAWRGLLARLQLPPRTLHEIVAADSLSPHFHYRRFHRPKKGGGVREIAEPEPKLKRLQREVIALHFGTEQPHPASVAYRKGHSTADHVWAHAGAEVIVLADVQDFFPNTHADRVETWWRGRVDDDSARLLTLLTTDRGGLPQGAPTSPGLSNFVNRELDARLTNHATVAGATYTRYCDDLAFSWPAGWGPPSGFEAAVRTTLHEFGYALHPVKGWRVYERGDEPEVTGAILTRAGRVRLPDRLVRVMRELARSDEPGAGQRLKGYAGYAEMMTRKPERKGVPEKRPGGAPEPRPVSTPVPELTTDPDDPIPF